MAHKSTFFFFGKIHLFKIAMKNLTNKLFNFDQLILSSVVQWLGTSSLTKAQRDPFITETCLYEFDPL